MAETFTTGSLSGRSPIPILQARHNITSSTARNLYKALRNQNVSPINIKKGSYQLPPKYQSLEGRTPTRKYGSLLDTDTKYIIPEKGSVQSPKERLTEEQKQTVVVAVSKQDLDRFNQAFRDAGYNTAGELLAGIRKGKVKKQGDTYIIQQTTKKTTTKKKERKADPGYFEKLMKTGVKETKEGFKDFISNDPYEPGEKRINPDPGKNSLKRITGPIKTAVGFSGVFIEKSYEAILKPVVDLTKPRKREEPYQNIPEGQQYNPKFIKQQQEETITALQLAFISEGLRPLAKPGSLTKLAWHEQDVKIATKELNIDPKFTYKRPGYDIYGNRERSFQPFEKKDPLGLVKSKEIQAQLKHKPVETIKLEVEPGLKESLIKRGAEIDPKQLRFLEPEPSIAELTSEVRYKRLLEIAKQEVKPKPEFYQREIIEYVDPRTKPAIQIEKVTSTPKRLKILASKKAQADMSQAFKDFDSRAIQKGRFNMEALSSKFDKKTTLAGSPLQKSLHPRPPQYEYVIIPNTQLPYWQEIQKDSIIEIEQNKIRTEIDAKTILANITYAKILSRSDTKLKAETTTGTISKLQQETKIRQIQQQESIQISKTANIQQQAQIQEQAQIQTTEQAQISNLLTRQIQAIPKTQIPSPRPQPVPPKIPSLKIPSLPSTEREQTGFTVEVKRKGIFVDIGGSSDIEESFKKGRDIIKRTARASFRIKDSSGEIVDLSDIQNTFTPSNMLRRSKISRNVIVEKARFRIDTPGEKAEITQKGIFASKTKTKKKKKKALSFF